jgi:hypothetical protein
MIITKLQGGLGNQLFQWAYGKYLSERFSTELSLDLSFYQNQFGNTPRTFELTNLPNLKVPERLSPSKPIVYLNDDFTFKPIDYKSNHDYFLNGFWQSEKYFKSVSNLIKLELSPTEDKLNELSKKIEGNSISLHIRRTDYLTSNGFHPTQTIQYYQDAIRLIGDYKNIYIFSDDIEWCKNNLTFKNTVFIEGQSNIEDLWLMSLCDNNVIANSSFSWWGAWLNNNPNKIVVAPKLWFGEHTGINSGDIIPENWIKI